MSLKFEGFKPFVFYPVYEFVIISDRKTIMQRRLTFFIWFEVQINHFSTQQMV